MLRKPPRTAANTVLSLPTADQNVRWGEEEMVRTPRWAGGQLGGPHG